MQSSLTAQQSSTSGQRWRRQSTLTSGGGAGLTGHCKPCGGARGTWQRHPKSSQDTEQQKYPRLIRATRQLASGSAIYRIRNEASGSSQFLGAISPRCGNEPGPRDPNTTAIGLQLPVTSADWPPRNSRAAPLFHEHNLPSTNRARADNDIVSRFDMSHRPGHA